MRTNDDSPFATRGWITDAVKVRQTFSPVNIGVVGPNHRGGNEQIITHDLVHRSHLEIFNMTYYPDEFKNWFVDAWISLVYGAERTCKLRNLILTHHYLPTRYKVDNKAEEFQSILKRGKGKFAMWMFE
eukprot:Selendium_serpulae@DN6188_c0_g1_i3.p1